MFDILSKLLNAEPDKTDAARSVASHLTRFWDPRMRHQIVTHYRAGGAGLEPVPHAAIALLADEAVTAPRT